MRFFAKVDKFMWLRPKTKIIFAGPPFDPLFGPKPDAIWKKRQKIAFFSRFLKILTLYYATLYYTTELNERRRSPKG